MNKQTELQIAEKAFREAINNAYPYPADLIARLYDDVVKARRRNAAKRR